MGDTAIEWTDKTWNPTVGCRKVSEGCRNCYAKTLHDQRRKALLAGKPMLPQYAEPFEVLQLMPDRLLYPLTWRKPSRIFVNSVSDLFHVDVPDAYLDQVFAVMMLAHQLERGHTFQILTKRPERMAEYFRAPDLVKRICTAVRTIVDAQWKSDPALDEFDPREQRAWTRYDREWLRPSARLTAWLYPGGGSGEMFAREEPGRAFPSWIPWPLPNVWLGTSVENQAAADERIPHLLETPATVRFLSCEPLLGPVNLEEYLPTGCDGGNARSDCEVCAPQLHWVIVGGESGPKARPMHPNWPRSLRDQCTAAGVAFFFKQWGEWAPCPEEQWHGLGPQGMPVQGVISPTGERAGGFLGSATVAEKHAEGWRPITRLGKKRAGRQLDGRTWDEYPQPAEVAHA